MIAFASAAEAMRYKSGAVTGYEKFTYGKFITRMKAPNKKGTVSSFFTYWNGPDFYPGGWNELDVEIVPSVSQTPFSMNIIYGDGQAKHETQEYDRSFDPKDEWHIYEMAWTPDFVSWSIDNKEVRRVKAGDPAMKYLNKGQSVMMNFWTPTFESWGKGFNAADMPWYVLYDYVETYTYNSETNGFDFRWRDDFSTFDAERWHKSDNTTFDANSTTFRASQSYIENGHLVLKMEPDTHQQLYPGQHYRPTTVVPVETEPAYEHKGALGEKLKKEDEHYDVLAEQHMSHIEHEHHAHAAAHHGYGPYAHDEYGRTPREMAELGYYHDRYAYPGMPAEEMRAYHHYPEGELAAEAAAAHYDPHHVYAEPHHPLGSETGPHDAMPIHSASTEVHVASPDHYYGDMFRHGHVNQEEHYAAAHHGRAYAVADNLSIHGGGIAHHDVTPYEHSHGYDGGDDVVVEIEGVIDDGHHEDRHYVSEPEVIPLSHISHEVEHEHVRALPSYEELLYAYLHHGEHPRAEDIHHDGEPVIAHHEVGHLGDVLHAVSHPEHEVTREYHDYGEHDIDYSHRHEGTAHLGEAHEWAAFVPAHEEPHLYGDRRFDGDFEHIREQAHDQKHNPEHYRHDVYREAGPADHTYHDERRFDDHRHEAEHHSDHHEGGPYWRGDHYDDHDKTDEDFRHDTTEHTYHGGDTYGHDVDYHEGTQLMHDIEHEYDQLFHEIEAQTKHGVEHHDVEHALLPLDGGEGHAHPYPVEHEVSHAHPYPVEHEVIAYSEHEPVHEEEGPSMYAWAVREQHAIEPQVHHQDHHQARHHETFAEQYYREHHLASDYNLHEHDEPEPRFEPLGAHPVVHHTVAHRETLVPHHVVEAPHHEAPHQVAPHPQAAHAPVPPPSEPVVHEP